MADLIQEFFQRDLSEAEQESLNGLLAESPDAASRYENLLEQNYRATGLPRPRLPRSLRTLRFPGSGGLAGASPWVKILVLSLAAAGAALWKFWPRPQAEVRVPSAQTAPAAVAAQDASRRASLPWVRPQPVKPSEEGQELSVVVESPQTALVTVRILDAAGREVRALYTGFVQPGRWSFQWDGMLSNGQPAPAGNYRIDVQSGASHQTKDIKIKLK
jgi:FlgD Ig-like domain